jgi:hypothetical protein
VRKIVQIATTSEGEERSACVYALTEDGALWEGWWNNKHMGKNEDGRNHYKMVFEWRRLPGLPVDRVETELNAWRNEDLWWDDNESGRGRMLHALIVDGGVVREECLGDSVDAIDSLIERMAEREAGDAEEVTP